MSRHCRAIASDDGYTIITCWFCPTQFVQVNCGLDVEENIMHDLLIGEDTFVCCGPCCKAHAPK